MRAAVRFPFWTQVMTSIGQLSAMQSYMTWVRNLFKSELDPSNTGNDYKVSDVFIWAGWGGASPHAFIVEERDGAGAVTGNMWMFVFPYHVTNINASYLSSTFQSHATYLRRWGYDNVNDLAMCFTIWFFPAGGLRRSQITLNGGHTFLAGDVGMEIRNAGDTKRGIIESVSGNVLTVRHTVGGKWAAADTLTDVASATESGTIVTEDWRSFPDVGFSNFSTLALSSGDFTTSASSPYSAITSFLPKEGTGAPFRNYKGRATIGQVLHTYSYMQLLFDNSNGQKQLSAYCSRGQQYRYTRDVFISGDVLVNSDGSTTYTKGGVGWTFTSNEVNGQYTEFYYHEGEYYGGGSGVAGEHTTFLERSHQDFTLYNHLLPTTPQKYAEGHIALYNPYEAKGWINPNIVRIQGPANHMEGLMTDRGGADQNLCLKIHDAYVFPWLKTKAFGIPNFDTTTEWPPLHLWL